MKTHGTPTVTCNQKSSLLTERRNGLDDPREIAPRPSTGDAVLKWLAIRYQ